ncbi:MAG: hypothetical protein ABFD80_09180 [Acidobacteriota bacterium]
MRKTLVAVAALFFAAGLAAARTGQVNVGVSVADGKLRSFYLSIGDYYRVPEPLIVSFRDRFRVSDEELPVVFFLAGRARVEPSVIMGLRLKGRSWLDIAFHFNLTPDIFFVSVGDARVGPPYGRAYGYYRKYGPRREWRKIALKDKEVVDLVNLRFMSEYHHMSPEAVMKRRGGGEAFPSMNEAARKDRDKGRDKDKGRQGKPEDKSDRGGKPDKDKGQGKH